MVEMAGLGTKIKIDHVTGGSSRDQQALKRNYFLATGVNDTYQLFSPDDELIPTTPPVVAAGFMFQFELKEMPEVTWTINDFDITDDRASGRWTNTHKIELDDGHFQAQSGPPAEETISSAAAS